MDKGNAVEFGSPKELLNNPNGIFSALVDAAGAETAAQLRSLAK